ncbi:MAG: hypothetical protein C0600_03980 [Ignavibacteria bacterium]|nr:MAG: hypothetical protein C0600_03980 [Ignavibacteria bacterium]
MKNWFAEISPRWIRVMYTVFAVLVVVVTTYNFMHVMFWRVFSNDQCQWEQVFTDSTRIHVHAVRKGSSGAKAGLKTGDILLTINDAPVQYGKQAERMLLATDAGESVRLGLERDHRPIELVYARSTSDTTLPFMLNDRIFQKLVIINIVPDGVTDRAGIKDGDILLRIDSVSVNSYYGPQYLLNMHSAGSVAEFLIDRDGVLMRIDVEVLKVFQYTYFAVFLLGFGFLLVGYFVVMARPQGSIQRKFARYGIYAMFCFGMSAMSTSYVYDPAWKVNFFIITYYTAFILSPPIFISYFLHFPVQRPVVRKRWLMPLLYGGTVIVAVFLWGSSPAIWGDAGLYTYRVIAYNTPFVYFFIGLGILTHSYFTRLPREQRPQLRPILQSAFIGIAAFVYVTIITTAHPFAIFLQPYLLLPALLIIGIPPAFGYSIVKHRLMDITVIIKRSVLYALITAAIAAIYLAIVFGMGNLLGAVLGETDNKLMTMIAFVVIALLFDPVKQWAQRIIDRLFYRERTNYQKALLEFSSELPRQINLDQILKSMVNRISGTMHVDRVSVSLCDEEDGCHVISQNIPEELCSFSQNEGGVYALMQESREPVSFALLDEDTRITYTQDREKLKQSGVQLMVPMYLKDRLLGAINVGPKKSGKVYTQEDMDLLSTVAGQAAIAIENARLHRSEIDKQKIKEQLSIAQRIQQGLLPKTNPPFEQLDISGISIPALTVGGDYYDYIKLSDSRLLVAVGDVSGKGMSAALYMSNVQGMIRFAAKMYERPSEILSSVNRLIYEGIERNSFITMILALFDFADGTVTVCRAGHTQPLVALNGGMSYMGSDGMGLGLEPGDIFDSALEEKTFALRKDGLLLLYSDGLTEAMDANMNEFGEDRVYQMVAQREDSSSAELQQRIIDEVERHRNGAEQNDDITLVVIRIR